MTTNTPDEFDALRTITKTLEPFKTEDQSRILRWISEKLGLTISGPTAAASTVIPGTPTPNPEKLPGSTTDIKTFIAEKKPKNDTQFAAVVAYYYQFEAPDKKSSITKDDLLEACRLGNYARPPIPGQTLLNAVNAGLLDKAERGAFSVNSVGENLVAITLPGDGTSGQPVRRKPGKKASGKKTAKKTAPKKAATKTPAPKAVAKKK